MPETDTLIKTTCPRDCYDACGMSVRVRGGVIQNVMGDREHHVSQGKLCGKCAIAYNGVFRDAQKRLSVPLRRVGKKGDGVFEAVSWDVALADIAARLKRISDPRTHLSHPLHRHAVDDCRRLSRPLLQPPRRHGSGPRHRVQQGGPCGAGRHVRHLAVGLRSRADRQRPLPDGLGRQPFAQRAAHALQAG